MEKWEQELKRHVNEALPESVDQRIRLTLQQLKDNRSKTFKLRYIPVAAAASVVLAFGASTQSPALAEAIKSIPVIGSVFELAGDVGMRRGSHLHLATELGQQVRIAGHEVTFTESLYDGSNINLGFTVSADDPDIYSFMNDLDYSIDGQKLTDYGDGISVKKLIDGTYAGTFAITTTGKLPDSFVLGIRSRQEGRTVAELPIERRGESASFAIAQTKTWNNLEMQYDAVSLFPTTTGITFRLRHIKDKSTSATPFWRFRVSDDQGRVLQPLSGFGGGNPNDGTLNRYFFEPFETVPKRVTIQPYFIGAATETKANGEWKGSPIVLSQGKAGSITVIDQKREKDNLTLTYEVSGERVWEQVDKIWLEDSKGNDYFKVSQPIRVEGSPDTFTLTFSDVNSADSIYIVTQQFNDPYFLKELEVTVDLTD
jgi:hypothetical protein